MNVLRFGFIRFFIGCFMLSCLVNPQVALAHAKNGTLTGTYNRNVERWRPVVKKYLKHYRIYSKEREGRILNIIKHESGGSPHARNGRHAGLVQFTPSWKHNYGRNYFKRKGLKDYHSDNRLSGYWNIRRICLVYKQGGTSKIKQHWKATYRR